jgi:F-type H+-transporting ATPase subunit b
MAETKNAHTEQSGGTGGKFPPFQKETFASQLVWLAIAFVALYVIASRFALPRVGGILEARRNAIASDLAAAQGFKDASDKEIATYEEELAAARNRAQAIGSDTRDKLHAQAESERKVLEEKLNTRLADAEKTIDATRRAAMGNVRSIASEAAAAIVQRLVGITPDSKAVENAVDSVLKG